MNLDPVEIRALIRAATKHTGTPVHDEDLEQDIALRALEAVQRLDHITHPRALLMKIVRDRVRDHWRRRRLSEDLDGIDQRFIAQVPEFESDLDWRRKIELLRRALDRLPASKRAVIELFYVRDHSIPQIAKMQNRSVSAIKMDLARSRRLLAQIVRALANIPRKWR
jgi:RNA polymerase sigma factor (sigma-70 family)